jgi:hypothetical protein
MGFPGRAPDIFRNSRNPPQSPTGRKKNCIYLFLLTCLENVPYIAIREIRVDDQRGNMKTFQQKWIAAICVLLLGLFLSGCGSFVAKFADNLSGAIMKQDDPEIVRDGAPTLMLLMDGMIEGSPNNPSALAAAAQMYSFYNSTFVTGTDPERAKILSARAKNYAFRALSLKNKCFRDNHNKPFEQFEPCAKTFVKKDVPLLSLVIGAWAGFIQTHSDNWDNVAEMANVRVLAERLLALDDTYQYGSPHLYMGVLHTFLPPALGGRVEEGRAEFEKAIAIGKGRLLTAHVLYARQIAMATNDRVLFERLIGHVRETPANAIPELTLINTIAKKDAEKLAADADSYFSPSE